MFDTIVKDHPTGRLVFHPIPRLVAFAILACLPSFTSASELRIASWNTAGEARSGTATVLDAIGVESVNGIVRPIDVLALQEQNKNGSDTTSILRAFDDLYGEGIYAAAVTPPGADTSGAGWAGLIYNTTTIDLLDSIAFGEVNTSAQARATFRYELQPDGYTESERFFVYSNHYKAGSSRTDRERRNVEAIALRTNLDSLGDGVAAILAGDFNIRGSDELMYQTLLSEGPGQAFDPINTPGDWHDGNKFRSVHTQSPATESSFNNQVTAGIDDRFDFQLVTDELLDGVGMDYIHGSYRAFGNNGTHSMNSNISSGTGASPDVLRALETSSDHLPIVADYALPVFWDCDGDRVVTVLDANCTPAIDLVAFLDANRFQLADANGDGAVGFEDFLTLSMMFGQEGEYTDGDFDKSGSVAFADFLILSGRFGQTQLPSNVPEPDSASMVFFLAFLGWHSMRTRPRGIWA